MTTEQFAYWLQGFVELNGDMPTPNQWSSIKDHLATVFVKVTPTVTKFDPVHGICLTPYPSLTDKITC